MKIFINNFDFKILSEMIIYYKFVSTSVYIIRYYTKYITHTEQ